MLWSFFLIRDIWGKEDMTTEDLDKTTPGGVYLCQVSEEISCGACCGLYNVADPGYESIYEMLDQRTLLFEQTPRDYDSLVEFETIVAKRENPKRPYPEFHHCRYIGLIGENKNRPGCLLHPLGAGNNNIDHRGLSDWGGLACASYFCPTCHQTPARYKKIMRICADNWYLYGLMATESEMLNTFFARIETIAGKELEPDLFINNQIAAETINDFFRLKQNWPFRETGYNRHGNYFFNDNFYPRQTIPYEDLGIEPSCFDSVLKGLGSVFRTAGEARQAEQILSEMAEKTAAQVS